MKSKIAGVLLVFLQFLIALIINTLLFMGFAYVMTELGFFDKNQETVAAISKSIVYCSLYFLIPSSIITFSKLKRSKKIGALLFANIGLALFWFFQITAIGILTNYLLIFIEQNDVASGVISFLFGTGITIVWFFITLPILITYLSRKFVSKL